MKHNTGTAHPSILHELALRTAAALALLSLLVGALAYQFRVPTRLDLGVGDELDIQGFYYSEQAGPASYRWTAGDGRVVFRDLGAAAPVLVKVRAQAWRYQDTVHGATVTVNGHPVGSIVKAGWRDWSFLISDPAVLKADALAVGLSSTPFVPSELYPDSQDHRALGVAVDWVEVAPLWAPAAPGSWLGLVTVPSPFRLLVGALAVLGAYFASWALGASARARWGIGLVVVLINGIQIAFFRTAILQAAILAGLALGVGTAIDGPLLSRVLRFVIAAGRWTWRSATVYGITLRAVPVSIVPVLKAAAFALVAAVVTWYLMLGLHTELVFIANNPLPQTLMGDFNIYLRAYADILRGADPYALRNIGVTFTYPPPALLIIAPFASLPSESLRTAVYMVVNLLLLAVMLWGVGRRYGYTFREIWWWYPLAFGFAPFLELLHIGQINLIAGFGIFLVWACQSTLPALAGAGLSLAAVTKVTPLVFFGYLAAARSRSAFAWGVLILSGAFVLSSALFGWATLDTYPDVFQGLVSSFRPGDNSQALVSVLHGWGWIGESSWRDVQFGLQVYLAALFLASGILAFLSREHVPFFLVLSLGAMVAPNVMYYHHYVFILLPVFLWIAWSRFHPAVALWCFVGLVLIQVDRWYWTRGLLPHLFVHLSLLSLLAWQVVQRLRAPSRSLA